MTLLVCALAWLFPAPAEACSCAPRSTQTLLRAATAVFEGYVLGTKLSPPRDQRVELAVVRAWKGVETERVELVTAVDSASCGVGLVQGQSYLVFATEQDGVLRTDLCSGTKPFEEASEDLEVLGMGATPFTPREATAEEPTPEEAPARGGCASCGVLGARALRPQRYGAIACGLCIAARVGRRRRRARPPR